MNNLSIDDIHKIREEHHLAIKAISFSAYKKALEKEIAPSLLLLEKLKKELKQSEEIAI